MREAAPFAESAYDESLTARLCLIIPQTGQIDNLVVSQAANNETPDAPFSSGVLGASCALPWELDGVGC